MTDAGLKIIERCDHDHCERLHGYITNYPPGRLDRIHRDNAIADDIRKPLLEHPELRYKLFNFGMNIYLRGDSGGMIPHWIDDPDHRGDGAHPQPMIEYLSFVGRYGLLSIEPITADQVPEEYQV